MSSPLTGKLTAVSILSVKGPWKENRLRWMSSIGGNREIVSAFVARLGCLHFGQFHASSPSSVSGCVKKSIHCASVTSFMPLPDGIGSDRYIKVLYVVEVCKDDLGSVGSSDF